MKEKSSLEEITKLMSYSYYDNICVFNLMNEWFYLSLMYLLGQDLEQNDAWGRDST